LDATLVLEIICSDNLEESKEEAIFEAVLAWGNADDSRIEALKQVLSHLR
jgi:hypothetical protein